MIEVGKPGLSDCIVYRGYVETVMNFVSIPLVSFTIFLSFFLFSYILLSFIVVFLPAFVHFFYLPTYLPSFLLFFVSTISSPT